MVYRMGNNFQWQTDTELDPPPDASKPQRSWEMVGFWLTTAVIILILAGGWFLNKRQTAQVDSEIRTDLQTLLDLQHAAFLAGDGDLFFTFHASDSDWQSAQLLPFNQTAQHAGFTITRVETNKNKVWANTTWREGNETYQRLLFFEGGGSRYQQIATDPAYWGKLETRPTTWGEIDYYAEDEDWLCVLGAISEDSKT